MADNDEEQSTQAERDAALFGPPGFGEYKKGETIRFRDPQSGAELTGKVIFVRAPAQAVVGGRVHPTVYWCFVQGEHLPRAVYPADVVEKPSEDRNTGS
jgi:hypothetical protein